MILEEIQKNIAIDQMFKNQNIHNKGSKESDFTVSTYPSNENINKEPSHSKFSLANKNIGKNMLKIISEDNTIKKNKKNSLLKINQLEQMEIEKYIRQTDLSQIHRPSRMTILNQKSPLLINFSFGTVFKSFLSRSKTISNIRNLLFFYLKKNIKLISCINQSVKKQKLYTLWNKLIMQFHGDLLELNETKMISIFKLFPTEFIINFLQNMKQGYPEVRLDLLEYLESKKESHLLKDKVLFFTLICKFRPWFVQDYIEELDIMDYKKAMEIAKKEKCWIAEAFLLFKQNQKMKSFDLFLKM